MKEIDNIINSNKLSGYRGNKDGMLGGKWIQKLEADICKRFNSKHAIAVNSATSGLWCAMANYFGYRIYDQKAYLRPTPEVIVTPYSMSCSATIPLLFNCKPVFVDIEQDFFCMDPEKIKKAITKNTVGIIAVDLFGQSCDYDKIREIAKRHNLFIIEDAAQAIGATYKNKFCGTLGDIGVLSFNQHKHINAGEGGMILTDNDEVATRLRMLMNHAECISHETNEHIGLVGMNLRMTEITAYLVYERLKGLNKILQKHIDGAVMFNIPVRTGCKHVFYKYAHFNEAEFYNEEFSNKHGYIKPLYQFPVFRNLGYKQNLCPTCEEVEENIFIAGVK